jgi:hypothetical protein
MKEGDEVSKLNEARSDVIEVVRDYGLASVDRSEGDIRGTTLSDLEAKLGAFEDAVREHVAEDAEQDVIVRMLMHIARAHGAVVVTSGPGWAEAQFHLGTLVYTLTAALGGDFRISLEHTGSTCGPSAPVARVLDLWSQVLDAVQVSP